MADYDEDGHDGRRKGVRGRHAPAPRQPKAGWRGPRLRQLSAGGNWHMQGTFLGVRLRESTFTSDKGVAVSELQRRQQEILTAYQGKGKPTKATYGEAASGRLAGGVHSAATVDDSKAWVGLIGAGTLCEDVDWDMVHRLAAGVLRPGFKPATLKRTVVEVRATLVWANRNFGLKRGCPPANFPPLKGGKPRDVYLKPRDCLAMHAALVGQGEQLAADVLCVGVCEGPRRGELHGLLAENVDLRDATAELRDTKSGSPDQIRDRTMSDIRPWALDTLRRLSAVAEGQGAIFVKPDGRPFPSKEAMGSYVNKRLHRVAKELGIADWERMTLHVLRHTAATNHYLLTRDIHDVQVRFDWRDRASTERYLKRVAKVYGDQVAELYGLAGSCHSPRRKAGKPNPGIEGSPNENRPLR